MRNVCITLLILVYKLHPVPRALHTTVLTSSHGSRHSPTITEQRTLHHDLDDSTIAGTILGAFQMPQPLVADLDCSYIRPADLILAVYNPLVGLAPTEQSTVVIADHQI